MIELIGGLGCRAEGTQLALIDPDGAQVALLTFALPGEPADGWSPDENDLATSHFEGVTTRLRSDVQGAVWRLLITVDNATPEPVALPFLGVGVLLGSGITGWSWTTDLDALLVFPRAAAEARTLLLRMRGGYCAAVREAPVFIDEPADGAVEGPDAAGRAQFYLGPPERLLGAHRRHQVLFEASVVDGLDAAAGTLPAWLPQTIQPVGSQVDLALPDQAVVAGPGVTCTVVDTDVVAHGEPGFRWVDVHGPRGVERLPLAWVPRVDDLLDAVVERVLAGRPGSASGAAAYVVVDAVCRGLVPDRDRALDWLDRVDWSAHGTLLGDATAGCLAALEGESLVLDAVWRHLSERTPTPGYGLVVTRLILASVAAVGTPPPRAAALLDRAADDPFVATELALLGARPDAVSEEVLAGWAAGLGGPLPGRPMGLPASDAARWVSLLKLTPEGWASAPGNFAAAAKAEAMLLADFVDEPGEPPRHRDLDGLAWLLLGQLGI